MNPPLTYPQPTEYNLHFRKPSLEISLSLVSFHQSPGLANRCFNLRFWDQNALCVSPSCIGLATHWWLFEALRFPDLYSLAPLNSTAQCFYKNCHTNVIYTCIGVDKWNKRLVKSVTAAECTRKTQRQYKWWRTSNLLTSCSRLLDYRKQLWVDP